MLKQIAAELNFRLGRKSGNIATLQRSARQNYYNFRAATELATKHGIPDQICLSLLMSLSGLRESAQTTPLENDVKNFLQLAFTQMEISRGQFFQDLGAHYFTNHKHDGYFVEVGVGNGEHLSNTYMLEKHFGWRGLLLEPDRRFHASIENCRDVILDKRAAFSEDNCQLQFMEDAVAGTNSSLVDYRNDNKCQSGTIYHAQTVTLTTALGESQAPRDIDYISIDTEGSELEVLRGIDLQEYNVRFFTIEHNLNPSKKQAILDYLQPYGYQEVCSAVSHIDVWLRKTNA